MRGRGSFLYGLERVEPEEVVVVDNQPGGVGLQAIDLPVQGIALLSVHVLHGHLCAPDTIGGANLVRGDFGGSIQIFLELSVTVHPRSCIAATMTTIWRPHWLIKHIEPVEEEVPDDDVPDVKVEPPADDDGINGEDGTTPSEGKGAKRKRAPPTKGPCEHGVKYRSKCKVCQCLSARSSAL